MQCLNEIKFYYYVSVYLCNKSKTKQKKMKVFQDNGGVVNVAVNALLFSRSIIALSRCICSVVKSDAVAAAPRPVMQLSVVSS
jgi:hypothetical protein